MELRKEDLEQPSLRLLKVTNKIMNVNFNGEIFMLADIGPLLPSTTGQLGLG
jgi:hypothetical protein